MKEKIVASALILIIMLIVAWYSLPSAQAQMPGVNNSCNGNGSSYNGSCNNSFNIGPLKRLVPASVSTFASNYFDENQIVGSITFYTEDSCDDCVQLSLSIRNIILHDKAAKIDRVQVSQFLGADYNGVFIAVRDKNDPPSLAVAISKALNLNIVENPFDKSFDCAIFVLPYHGS